MTRTKTTVYITHRDSVPGTPRDFDERTLAEVGAMVNETLDGCQAAEMIKGRSVLIKPNLVRPNPDLPTATTTDSRVIIATLRYCRDAGASEIGVGDKPGIGLSCRGAQQLLGIDKFIDEVGAHFIYFDESEEVWEPNPQGELEEAIPIPSVVRNYEVFIDLPKLKLHMHTGISLGIKNLFGLVPEHFRMKHHREDLHRFLVDYLYLVKPDITLIDGIWALEGQAPICGTPVKDFNVLVASPNVVAVDSVGSYLMGVDPNEITMIRMAANEGFGPMNLPEIDIRGAAIEPLRKHFVRPILSSQDAYPGIDVMLRGACVGCLSSLRHALDRLHLSGKLKENPQTIVLGMRHEAEELKINRNSENVWCYGNCCLEQFVQHFEGKANAHWLQGCPPHFMDFYRSYCQVMGIDLPETD